MKEDQDDILLRVAGSVADGEPVDWEGEGRAHEDLKRKLHRLRLIENIAAAHQTPPPRDEEDPEKWNVTETADPAPEGIHEPPPSPSRWGSLEILEKIGRGAFGEVYRAHDPSLQRDVALKLLRPERAQDAARSKRFLEEARRLARVRHPNVLVVHGADRHEGRVGLWTDLLQGETLEDRLMQQGPFGPNEATLIGIDLCGALAAVHAAGLVHRDVKTSNVMREKGGQTVLMDFSAVTERSPWKGPSESDPVSGTPLFMAPELFRGEDGETRSDIYSLGVLLYRLVSGRFPIEARTVSELSRKHRRGESVPLRDVRPDLPAAFVQVVDRALAPDPEHRYPTAGEMERALRASIGSFPEFAPRGEGGTKRRRFAFPASLAAVLILAAGFSLAFWLSLRPGPFQVEASLYRAGAGAEERLLHGGRVSSGDRLFLEIEGSKEMHVYVLNEDEMGNAFVLFPLPNLDLQNPLPPGVLHRLPGREGGAEIFWEVDRVGGEETFLVIASRGPLVGLEKRIEPLPLAGSQGPVALNPQGLQTLRGIGGLTEPAPPGENAPEGRLSNIFTNLSGRAASTRSLWVWQIQLENPVP